MRRLLITLGALFMLACTTPTVGSECQGGPAENDCPEGAVCTLARAESTVIPDEPNNERFYCRSICDGDENCPSGFQCRRSAGTMQRACQPSNNPTDDGGV